MKEKCKLLTRCFENNVLLSKMLGERCMFFLLSKQFYIYDVDNACFLTLFILLDTMVENTHLHS